MSVKAVSLYRTAASALTTALLACMQFSVFAAPNIIVTGNNIWIPSSTSASSDLSLLTGATFTETVVNSETQTHQFVINNTGSTTMTISGFDFTGTDASQFSLAQAPSTDVAPGGKAIFAVAFTPTSVATSHATISILSNAPNYPSFVLNVRGFGVNTITGGSKDLVAFFGQPAKLKCKDGICTVSGTVFVANAKPGNAETDAFIRVTFSTNGRADFHLAPHVDLQTTLPPPAADKPLKYKKLKFTMEVPEGSFKLFGSANTNNPFAESNLINNVFSADVFTVEP